MSRSQSTSATQIRGNCQCCGRDQAVVGIRISKHGYTVDHGYFNGVCSGHRYAPLQLERDQADAMIRMVREDVIRLRNAAADPEDGRVFPATVTTHRVVRNSRGRTVYETIPFAEGNMHQQHDAIHAAIQSCRSRANSGESWAHGHAALAGRVHGTELRVAELPAKPARIEAGEPRQAEGGRVLTASYQDGANVRYAYTNSAGNVFKTRMGVQAWRRLPIAA